jgi:hypothetical protein
MKPFISTTFYGVCNYLLAFTLMSSPWLFGTVHVGGASLFLPLIFGWLQLIMAIFSNHKLGFIKVFPVPMHCVIDVIGGSFLMMSPFVYTYYTQVPFPQPQFLLGLIVFLLGIFTQKSPLSDEPHHVMHDGLMNSTADIDEELAH